MDANHFYGMSPLSPIWLFAREEINNAWYTTYSKEMLETMMEQYKSVNPSSEAKLFENINSFRCTCLKNVFERNKVCAIPTEVEKLDNWMENLPHDIRERPITKLAMPGAHDAAAAELDGSLYDDTLTGLHLAQNSITVGGLTSLINSMMPKEEDVEEANTDIIDENLCFEIPEHFQIIGQEVCFKDVAECLIHNYPSCRQTFINFVLAPFPWPVHLVILPFLTRFLDNESVNVLNDDSVLAQIDWAINAVRSLSTGIKDVLNNAGIPNFAMTNVAKTQYLSGLPVLVRIQCW